MENILRRWRGQNLQESEPLDHDNLVDTLQQT